FMKPYAYEEKLGTQWWAEHDVERLEAYYGSMEEYKSITSWKQMRPAPLEKNLAKALSAGEVKALDHGWDVSKSIYELSAEEIEAAAVFRGGHFLPAVERASSEMERKGGGSKVGSSDASVTKDVTGDFKPESNKLYEWECENGHRFKATLEYVLLGGGWCTQCPLDSTSPDTKNRFLSQLLR
ncbi:MAG: hypothetical protein LUD72_12565, partial [Bacteroidales bacterium]|nr:hypothetical protein [Bacteroidales bacterium]